jgi:hypothetical protein
MINRPTLLTTLAVGILSVLTFWQCIGIGRFMGNGLQATWTWVATGTILIAIGVAEIFLALPWMH